MPWRARARASSQADIVGVWPAAVWILVGTHFYLLNPQHFVGWKGALYYVAGTAAVALIAGIVSLNLRRALGSMLAEIFPVRDRFTDLIALLLRIMLGAVEALLVALVARWSLDALG